MKWCWLDNYFYVWKGWQWYVLAFVRSQKQIKLYWNISLVFLQWTTCFFQWTLTVFKNNWQTLAGTIRLLLSVGFWVHSLGSRFHCNNASDPASFLTGVSVCHKHPTWEKIINIFSLERIRNKIVIAQQCISWWTNLT